MKLSRLALVAGVVFWLALAWVLYQDDSKANIENSATALVIGGLACAALVVFAVLDDD